MKKVALSIILIVLAAAVILHESSSRLAWPITNAKQNGKVIIAFGDGLTSGYGASTSRGYPGELEKYLGLSVVNLGQEGDTAASAQQRLADVLALKPNYVIITLGATDLRQQVPLDITLTALDDIFTKLTQSGAMVAYLAISPPLVGDNWLMAIQDLCRKHGIFWIDQVMDPLWDDPELMADSLHPNDAGYSLMAEKIYAALKQYL